MKQFLDKLVKILRRRMHDWYASANARMGRKLCRSGEPDARAVRPVSALHPAGQAQLDNRLEADFYQLPETRTLPISYPQADLYHFHKVWAVGDHGNVFLEDGRLLDVCQFVQRLPSSKIRRPIPFLSQRVRDPVFHLTGFAHDSHGHFILNHLPRLMVALDLLRKEPKIKILCAFGHSKWQLRYLSRLGIDPQRVIECTNGTLQIDELFYVPTINGTNNHPDPAIYRAIRDRIVASVFCELAVPLDQPPRGNSVFISRADAPDKRISNEAAIIEATRDVLGPVDRLTLSELSLPQQILKFNAAPVIIGPVGQGLTNLLFTTGKLAVVLDRGAFKPAGWGANFRDLAILAGNRALRFHSGTEYQEGKRHYSFPEEQYRAELKRLVQCAAALPNDRLHPLENHPPTLR